MIEELQTASSLLNVALERYLTACFVTANCYNPSDALNGISRAISDLIPRQLDLIATYETKFKQAKATINQIRNATLAIVPVNALPPDILVHIFQLVRDEQPGYFNNKNSPTHSTPWYPETLTHICWRWRQIAIGSRMLWSQIDLAFSSPSLSRRLLARAEVFASRSGSSSLCINLIDTGGLLGGAHNVDAALNELCASIATRARSLNMSCKSFNQRQFSDLQTCLSNCIPGTLDEIVLTNEFGKLPDQPHVPDRRLELERSLLPVRVLRLTGVYFHWTSQAYHGLVELHLVPAPSDRSMGISYPQISIPRSQFIEILSRSPRLRVLHLGLKVVVSSPYNRSHTVSSLVNLEVLNLHALDWEHSSIVLKMLAPGSKPLRLSVQVPATAHPLLSSNEFTSFVARSNITELYVECESKRRESLSLSQLCRLLHVPGLRTLSLADFKFSWKANPPRAVSLSQLDTLRLGRCNIDPGDLQKVANMISIQKLKLAGCTASGLRISKVKCNIPVVESVSIGGWDMWD